jgi:hypothetical protein
MAVRRALLVPAVVGLVSLPAAARAADPTMSDCIQANSTAVKLRADKKLRQAREQWLVCAAASCDAEIRKVCTQRVEDANKAIPTVVFEVTDATGNPLTAVKVSMDGQPLVDQLEGTAISLDPGLHTFRFETQGTPPVEKQLLVMEAVKERHEKIVLNGGAVGPAPPGAVAIPPPSSSPTAASPPSTAPAAASSPTPDTRTSGWGTQKTVSVIIGGVGVAGLAVGTIFGLVASHDWSNAQSECRSPTNCPSHGASVNDHDATVTAGTVSTVSFIVGGVALAGAAVLYLTAPHGSGEPASVAVGVSPAGLLVRGAFW